MTSRQNEGKKFYPNNKNQNNGNNKKYYKTEPTEAEIMKDAGVKVVLADGKEREMKFDLNTLVVLQKEFKDVEIAFKGLHNMDLRIVRFMLYAVLITSENDKDFTEIQAGSLVTMQNFQEVVMKLQRALEVSTPLADADSDTEAVKGQEGN